MMFLPRTDLAAQEVARTFVESEVLREGFYIYGWRQAPVDVSVIGTTPCRNGLGEAVTSRPDAGPVTRPHPSGPAGS